jgi:hypothetical protein
VSHSSNRFNHDHGHSTFVAICNEAIHHLPSRLSPSILTTPPKGEEKAGSDNKEVSATSTSSSSSSLGSCLIRFPLPISHHFDSNSFKVETVEADNGWMCIDIPQSTPSTSFNNGTSIVDTITTNSLNHLFWTTDEF